MANTKGNDELKGSKFIMCWKVTSGTSTQYVPLINNMTFTDSDTGNTYRFSSDYLASNYKGVVLAKGAFNYSVDSTNAMVGMPTYIKSSYNIKDDNKDITIDKTTPYYYNMNIETGFVQFIDTEGLNDATSGRIDNTYTLSKLIINSEDYPSSAGYSVSDDLASGQFNIIKDSRIQILDDSLMKNITVILTHDFAGSQREITANFCKDTLTSDRDDNLVTDCENRGRNFLYEVENTGYYFVLEKHDTWFYVRGFTISNEVADGVIVDNGANTAGNNIKVGSTVPCAYWQYNIRYAIYDYGVDGAKETAINNAKQENPVATVNSSYFEFAYVDDGKPVFKTEEIINIADLQMSSYIYSKFEIAGESLLTLKELRPGVLSLTFATPSYEDEDLFEQVVVRFDLYNFYTFMSKDEQSNDKLYEWNDGVVEDATIPDVNDTNNVFTCKINVSDFNFGVNDYSLDLYDANQYVATIYKNAGNPCQTVEDLANVAIKIMYNSKTYENVQLRNYYSTKDDANRYYEGLKTQFIIGNYRDNATVVFWKWDFNPWLFGIRINCALGLPEMKREVLSQSFRISDGIGYDYFFDNDTYISLSTFYIPLKISYWIILISSVLIIKVLGTAIWGVIKRFYEITLYYLAMPAMASTIPLDDGNRFNQHIIRNLFNKVLGTYGVILGINVFFILLTPVRSLSNIFTAEDIATSGSYFLIHLPFGYKVLNSYVYILFVLVAFTMIDSLPKVISALMGNENGDILTSGQRTKEQVGKDMKSATDMISGRSLIDSTKKAGQTLKDTVPGIAVAGAAAKKVKGAVEWGIQKHHPRLQQGQHLVVGHQMVQKVRELMMKIQTEHQITLQTEHQMEHLLVVGIHQM